MLGLVVSLLASQAVYEWVDGRGQPHFTNVVSTIPQGVQPRELRFEEPVPLVREVEAPERSPEAQTLAPPPAERDGCALAQDEVDALEQQLAQAEESARAEEGGQAQECQQVLNTLGEGAWLRCQAGRALPPEESPLQAQLDQAREALRRAHAGGCR